MRGGRLFRIGRVQCVVRAGLTQVGLRVVDAELLASRLERCAADQQGDLAQRVRRAAVLQLQRQPVNGAVQAELQRGRVRRAHRFAGGRGAVQQVDRRIVRLLLGLRPQSDGRLKAEQRTDQVLVR